MTVEKINSWIKILLWIQAFCKVWLKDKESYFIHIFKLALKLLFNFWRLKLFNIDCMCGSLDHWHSLTLQRIKRQQSSSGNSDNNLNTLQVYMPVKHQYNIFEQKPHFTKNTIENTSKYVEILSIICFDLVVHSTRCAFDTSHSHTFSLISLICLFGTLDL